MAKRGLTGPNGLFEGPNGLERIFAQSIPVNWEDPSLEVVTQTVMKKYCSLIYGQPVLEAVLDLKRRDGLVAAGVEHVRCDIFQTGFDIAGGGGFGSKDHPQTKEQADYNLKYLIAAALLDDQVGPAQLEPARIQAPDAQALLARVEVHPDEQFTARYPQELCARIAIRTKDQRILIKEQLGYEGGLANPMSWDRTVEKFHWLSEAFAGEDLRSRLIQAVQQLDTMALSDLMNLLAQFRPTAAFPTKVVRFACHFGKSPDLLGPPEIRVYLLHLTQERCLAASSVIVTVSALRFFYHTTLKRPWVVEDDIPTGRQAKKLPVVLSRDEVVRFLSAVDNLKHRVIPTVCYATGLRISEAVRLRPAAIDSKRMVIRVEQGKGRKDRYVMLPPKLLDMLRDYWKRAHPREWLFPGRLPGQPVSPLTIDRTCREVREQCGIGKPISPHSLRHAACSRTRRLSP